MTIRLSLERSPEDKRDWQAKSIYAKDTSIPGILDLRKTLLPVRDQGSQGSCAAQAASCMKEWQEELDVQHDGYFSPQFIYNLRKNQDSEGMYTRDLMSVLSKYGVCNEVLYPYGTMEAASEEALEKASDFKISNYARVNDVDTLKTALATDGVCIIAVPVYNYGKRMWYKRSGDVYQGGHAMAVVGYNYDGFIIRNSWSEKWGDKGYTILPFEDWGKVWEAWTTVDGDSNAPLPKRPWWQSIVEFFQYIFKDWPTVEE